MSLLQISLIPLIVLLAVAGLMLVPLDLYLNFKFEGFYYSGSYDFRFAGWTLHRAEMSGPGRGDDRKRLGQKKEFIKGKDSQRNDEKEDPAINKSKADRKLSISNANHLKDPRIFMDAMPSIRRVLKHFMKAIRIKRLLLGIILGLEDPADTAVICGYLWSIASLVPLSATARIDPYFEGNCLDGSIDAEIEGRPLFIFMVFLSAMWERPIRKMLIEANWKGFGNLKNKLRMNWIIREPKENGNGKGIRS